MRRLPSMVCVAVIGTSAVMTLALVRDAVPAPPARGPAPPRPPQGPPPPNRPAPPPNQPAPPPNQPAPPPSGPAPGGPLAGLGQADLARFRAGQGAFQRPANPQGGLGPVFTENACARCHNAAALGGAGRRLVTHFGRTVQGRFDPMVAFGGPQVQNRGIGRFNGVNFVGEVVPPQATIVARRRTIPLFGLGLVDSVTDDAIVAAAQDEALAHPLTAGRVSLVVDPATGENRVGRFGWKAQQPTLLAFAGDANVNELGVTTPLFPDENCPQGDCDLLAANPARTDPNVLTNDVVQRQTDFMALLAPPPRGQVGADERAGAALFGQIGCADCHRPSWQTGASDVKALGGVTFSPYSDFLLHDMGALGDGIAQADAGTREMRTAPLWGLRFEPSYLHDGRARTPTDAILAHDGQGKPARDRFAHLGATQQAQLVAFLNSL